MPQASESECKTFCTFNYAPVCGKVDGEDQQTFGNECAMKYHACLQKKSKYLSSNNYFLINFLFFFILGFDIVKQGEC